MKAEDIVALDVKRFCTFTDVIVLCTGSARTHLRAIAAKIVERMGERDFRPLAIEGLGATDWVVMDYGDVVAHIFTDESRRYYNLERLWGDGQKIDWRPRSPRQRRPRKGAREM
jgi:ribosome-associated protein